MAIQILPGQDRVAALGQSMGTGLGQGLQVLMQDKLNKMVQQKQRTKRADSLQTLFGMDPEKASILSEVDDKTFADVFKYLSETEGAKALAQGLDIDKADDIPADDIPVDPSPITTPPPPEEEVFSELMKGSTPQGLLSLLSSTPEKQPYLKSEQQIKQVKQQQQEIVKQQTQSVREALGIKDTEKEYEEALRPRFKYVPGMKKADVQKGLLEDKKRIEAEKKFQREQKIKLASEEKKLKQQREIATERVTSRGKIAAGRLALQERKEDRQERAESFSSTKEFRKETFEKAKSSRQNLMDLERMEEIEDSEGLDSEAYITLLESSGIETPALMKPGTQEFKKIAQTFMRDVKNYVGGNVSNTELEQFLLTIPSLMQSPEGRKRVRANMKRFNRINILYNDTMQKLMDKYPKVLPLDLMEKTDKKASKKIKHITDQFKEDLKKPSPEGSGFFEILGAKALGSVVGLPGKLLKTVASNPGLLGLGGLL